MNLRDPEVLAAGLFTMGLCLVIQAVFMFLVLRIHVTVRRRWHTALGLRIVVPTILLATIVMAVSNLVQILIWFGVLHLFSTFSDPADALYFSGTTFTTLGTAKHFLVPPYRVLEPLEAMNGTLAAGLNTAVLFALLSNVAREHATLGTFFRPDHHA
jgi:hypothetical protein